MIIRPFERDDASACRSIYRHYVENTVITFEEQTPPEPEFEERLRLIASRYPFLVAESDGGAVIGYAYLDAFNARSAYRYTADLSIYVDKNFLHKNAGSRLYRGLETKARQSGIHSIVSIITAENERSLRFHEQMGFRCAGELKNAGFKFGRWLSVKYYQKSLA